MLSPFPVIFERSEKQILPLHDVQGQDDNPFILIFHFILNGLWMFRKTALFSG